jgi:hypothetical protein
MLTAAGDNKDGQEERAIDYFKTLVMMPFHYFWTLQNDQGTPEADSEHM